MHRSQSFGILAATGCFLGLLTAAAVSGQGVQGMPGMGHPPGPNGGAGLAVQDPGVRGGPAAAGTSFNPLDSTNTEANAAEIAYFQQAKLRFQEVDSVSGTIPGEEGTGLGPRFNGNSCAQCHAFPALGGSSPPINPLVAHNFPHLDGAANPIDLSGFLTLNGPIREARLVINPDTGLTDGSVQPLFTIQGRSDAPGATIRQINFVRQLANNNLSFRIPTPLFGLGLVEATSDAQLRANLQSTAAQRAALGIAGRFNSNGNTQTITRFGWKAQNQSLLMFAGEAYNVEQGVSNELFDSERFLPDEDPAVIADSTFNASCEDNTNVLSGSPSTGYAPTGSASEMSSDLVNFAAFARLLAPPKPATVSASQVRGSHLFTQVGCQYCHSVTLTTGKSYYPAMSNVVYHPYSDFALHHVGWVLADGVSQGVAGPDEFRTAPLWGLGQRVYFLHDGRTSNLYAAILLHGGSGSEANGVVGNFVHLSASEQQDLLNFLRSL